MGLRARSEPASATEVLVDDLARAATRERASAELEQLGQAALPALRAGLRDGRWPVRRGCAALLARAGSAESASWLLPLVRDPKAEVRLAAVYGVSRAPRGGDAAAEPVPVVPLLLERIWNDESERVRRLAGALLASLARDQPSPELASLYRSLLEQTRDAKLRRNLAWGLLLCQRAGIET